MQRTATDATGRRRLDGCIVVIVAGVGGDHTVSAPACCEGLRRSSLFLDVCRCLPGAVPLPLPLPPVESRGVLRPCCC